MTSSYALPLLLVLATSAGSAIAAEEATSNKSVVTYDKATGEFRAPTPEELAALQADAANLPALPAAPAVGKRGAVKAPSNEQEAALTQTKSAGGAVRVQVPTNLYSTATATIDADGNIVLGHGETPEADHEE